MSTQSQPDPEPLPAEPTPPAAENSDSESPQDTETLRLKAMKLRAEGKSFAQIAQALQVAKSYAHKLVNSERSKRSLRTSTSRVNAQDLRRHKFMQGMVAGRTARQAALDAGAPNLPAADAYAKRTSRSVQFQDDFKAMLARKGLGEERLAELQAEALGATKVVAVRWKGDAPIVVERPDYQTRQKALDTSWELNGRLGGGEQQRNGGTGVAIVLNLTMERKEMFEAITGQSLPCQVVDLDGNVIDPPPAIASE